MFLGHGHFPRRDCVPFRLTGLGSLLPSSV
jgi:hypothetical protein